MELEEIKRMERETVKQLLSKHKRLICISMILLLLAAGTFTYLYLNRPPDDFELIANSDTLKIESCYEDDQPLFTNSSFLMRSCLTALNVIPCDAPPPSDWIYKLTFNYDPITPQDNEVVVLIGPDHLTINGNGYTTPEGVDFYDIVETIGMLYEKMQ